MSFLKTAVSAAAVACLMGGVAVIATTAPAAARVVCNDSGDCWHTDARYSYPGRGYTRITMTTGISTSSGPATTSSATIATHMKDAAITKAVSRSVSDQDAGQVRWGGLRVALFHDSAPDFTHDFPHGDT